MLNKQLFTRQAGKLRTWLLAFFTFTLGKLKYVMPVVASLVIIGSIITLLTVVHPVAKAYNPNRQKRAPERPAVATIDGSHNQALKAYENLPLAFVENRGQTDERVQYYAQGSRYAFYLTRKEVVLSLTKQAGMRRAQGGSASSEARESELGAGGSGMPVVIPASAKEESPDQGVALALKFMGGNPQVAIEGGEHVPGEVNYLQGNDPSRWQTKLRRYTEVIYRELWPGVDMMLRGKDGKLKYEFRVRPGARLADIGLAYKGADGVALDDAGGLLIKTAFGVLRDSPPVSYQEINGRRVLVDSRYVLKGGDDGKDAYGFTVGANYQPNHELIIDPGVDYSTYIGGASNESGVAIAVDATGNAYVVGSTQSPDFPTTTGAFRRTGSASNNLDVFVTKLNSTGTALIYSTFIGGSNSDWGRALAIDSAGNAYLAGQTKSSNFPTTGGAFDTTFNVGNCPRCGIDQYDAFVAKLNPAGSGLVYSTFLGGLDLDDALSIAVDNSGNAYVGGETGSTDFPVTRGAFDTTLNGAFDAYITKLNASGTALIYSTYLGGTEVEYIQHIAVDSSGSVYAMGPTRSADFPTTPSAFDTTQNGAFDLFVAKMNPAGSALIYSTFLGGTDMDLGGSLAVDSEGNAYVTGGTISVDFPTTPGAFDTVPQGNDAFITKLNSTGTALIYSTLLGGMGSDGASAIVLDGSGNAYVTGGTDSANFPVTPDAFDPTFNGGGSDAFVTELNATGSALIYSTFIGGTGSEGGSSLALDSGGNIYVTGGTFSADFPTTPGAFDNVFKGDPSIFWGDIFVTKLATGTASPPPPPPTPSAPSLLSPANKATVAQPITFDWSDVAAAATYQIQIDDASTFTAPLVLDQLIASSQIAVGSLPAQRLWWRVRAVNSAGIAGPWSAALEFTAQAAPPPPSQPALSALSLSPASVVGGNASQGTLTLSGAAPSGGTVVTLTSSNTAAATVPASVTVAAGSTGASFTVTTKPVTASATVTITASSGGVTRTATLTVTPQPPPTTGTATLTLTATGRNGERVTSSPTGINVAVGSTGSASFATGASVTLSVTNGRDAIWSGACSSGGAKAKTCRLTLTGAASVTVNVQ